MYGRGLFGGASGMVAGRLGQALDGGKGGYSQDPKIRQRAGLMVQQSPQEEQRRRGLFGRMGDMFSSDSLAQTNAAGVTRGEQLGAMLMSLAGPQQQAQAMQILGNARARGDEERRLAEAQREEREQSKLAGVQADQERQQEIARLYALEDQFGLDRGALSMLPAEARDGVISELAARRFTPEAPDLPSSVREYEYARQQGYQGSFQDWQAANPRGTSVSVNTGSQVPQVGSIPQGYQMRAVDSNSDGQPDTYRMEPIEGGPVAEASESAQASQERFGAIVLDEIDRAIGTLAEGGPFTAGRISALGRLDPESPASDLQRYYDTIRANMGFDRLQAIRESSPTGGGVGSLSDPEREAMADTLGALDVNARPEEQVYALARIQNSYMDAIYGTPQQIEQAINEGRLPPSARQYAQRRDPNDVVEQFRAARGGSAGDDAPPPGVDPVDWGYMTPAERALWRQ